MAKPHKPRGQYRADPLTATDKRCPKCEATKPVDEFHRNKKAPDGRQAYCKSCVKGRYDRDYAAAYQQARLADPEKAAMHKQAVRRGHLRRRYGLTPEQYEDLAADQNGVCAICGEPPQPRKVKGGAIRDARLAVDHCHDTNAIRGLLCMKCNTSVERIDTIPDWIEKAQSYLAQPPRRP